MTVLRWPEWLPDLADIDGSPTIRNVIPLTANSYGGMPTAVPWSTNTLDSRCLGSYSIKSNAGDIHIFAGDAAKLYRLPPGTGRDLLDVSRTVGGAYAVPVKGHWSMTSYGTQILATNGVDPIQSLLLGATNFTDLQPGDAGAVPPIAAAPLAKYIATVRDFVMVGNTTDGTDGPRPSRIWWSSLNQPDQWPLPGSTLALQTMSDYQDLQQTDLGNITGLMSGFAPGADAVVFMERGIYTASFVGPPLLFQIRVAQGCAGSVSPLSLVQDSARDASGALRPVIYYLSEDGFAAFDGSTSYAIGAQKFDRAFFADLDPAQIHRVQGVSDPRSRAVVWAYPSANGTGLHDRLLVYNWELARATIVSLSPAQQIEWLTRSMFGQSYTLDQLDSFGHLDIIQPPFDDPFWAGSGTSQLSLFDKDHRLNISNGPPMHVILETAESQPTPGRRTWVDMVRPLNDAGVAQISVGHRERPTDVVRWELPVPMDTLGRCPQRCTGRYIRFRMTMPEGQPLKHMLGLDIEVRPDSRLR
jgi:hypothetical protein